MQSDNAGPPSPAETAFRFGRTGAIVLAVIVLVVSGAVAFILNGGLFPATRVPASAVDALKSQVSRDYPGWTVERVYTYSRPGPANSGAEVSVLLRWSGSEDFRTALKLFYPGSYPPNPDWAKSSRRFFQSQRDASDFIAAFKSRHPEVGWVVGSDLFTTNVGQAASDGTPLDMAYSNVTSFNSSNGWLNPPPTTAKADSWHVTAVGAGLTWRYLGPL